MGKQPRFDVVRVGDGLLLRPNLHWAAAETLAYWWNHGLYELGPYCEVRPANDDAESVVTQARA